MFSHPTHLAYCLNRFLIVIGLVGAFNKYKGSVKLLTFCHVWRGMSGTVCRYPNVSAYDHSRVVISHNSADLYINANIVKAPEADREYILTQGVLKVYMDG